MSSLPFVAEGPRRLVNRVRGTAAPHVVDQALASGTNFFATIVVARMATPEQFGTFSIFLITYYITAGFNRWVPHSIAMTLDWDDERARNSYFFVPALVLGVLASLVLVPLFLILDPSFALLPLFLVPMLLQDALRMHSFAVHKPKVALASDLVWLATQTVGFLLISSAAGAATAWATGALCGALVARPWSRLRWVRRRIRSSLVSSTLEYFTLAGINYLAPLAAIPLIAVRGVGALQGAGVLRGPITLLMQGLVFHRMAGPPVEQDRCVREALRLSGLTVAATLACVPPLLLFEDDIGPQVLGSTWPAVRPLVMPVVLTLITASASFGPSIVVRKMGRFGLSATMQAALSPFFLGFALVGAALSGPRGFLYGTALAYSLSTAVWWAVLLRVARDPQSWPSAG